MLKKKIIAIISLSLSLVLFGCGTTTENKKDKKTETTTSTISSSKDKASTETASSTSANNNENVSSSETEKTGNNSNDKENDVKTEKNSENQSKSEESSSVSQEELEEAQTYFNKTENNGLLCSEYSNVKEISLIQLVYTGVGISEEMTQQEKEDYKEEIHTDISKIPRKTLEKLTKDRLNIELTSINDYEEFEKEYYSEKYDCYYIQHGDTNYQQFEFISGEKNSDGTYTFIYKGYSTQSWTDGNFELKCYVNDNGYTIISNVLMK